MKASQIISQLQDIIQEFGDIEIASEEKDLVLYAEKVDERKRKIYIEFLVL